MFRSLLDYNFYHKRVLVRCDFNLPLENGAIRDDFRIHQTLPTINHLIKSGAKLILLSHLGRPKGYPRAKLSLRPVSWRLSQLLKQEVRFVNRVLGRKVQRAVKKLKPSEVIILENLRFQRGEETNDQQFAASLSKLGDVYVNEAFSMCHRAHASVDRLPLLLPRFAGLNLAKEVEVLSQLIFNPLRPLVVVIGGAKIESKIEVIENFLKRADHLILGGKIVNVILRVKGICLGKPWPSDEVALKIKGLEITNPKIHLPVDTMVAGDPRGESYIREAGPGSVRKEEYILDIGQESIKAFQEIIKGAATVFWAGPLGFVENPRFDRGTEEIAKAIAINRNAFKVAGGGDTIIALRKFNLLDKFSHLSTGGGAMLTFLSGNAMPGLQALET